MNIYSIPPLLSALAFFSFGAIVVAKGREKVSVRIAFVLHCLMTFWWQFTWFILFNVKNPDLASILVKVGYSGIIFLPATFFHFYSAFLNKDKKWYKFYYLLGFIFLIILWATNAYINNYYVYFWGYYPKANFIHPLYLIYLTTIVVHSLYILFSAGRGLAWRGIRANQIKYLFIAFFIFCFASIDFLVNYGIEFYPIGFIFITISLGIMVYTIAKYHLMDIRVAFTRLGIFVVVYSLVLGIPFWIGAKLLGLGLWLIPTGICAVLATLGPTIYLYLQRKAEYKILQKEKDAHNLLRQASAGMLEIHDSQKILNFIVDLVIKILHFKTASVYLWDGNDNQYISRASSLSPENKIAINPDDVLVEYLKEKSSPLVYEEIKMMVREGEDSPLRCIMARMEALSAHAIIPIYKNGLLGFLALGERYEHSIFDQDLLGVLIVLSNQAALAIENAMYYEESQKDWVERARDSRLKTMGSMGTGIAHQIRNRLNAISAQCMLLEDLQDSFDPAKATPEDFYQLRDGCKKVLGQILKSIGQGEEIVDAIKNYAKRTEATPQVVPFEQTISGAMHLLKLSRKEVAFTLKENYPQELKLWTNFSMLQDMLYNMLDNSNDAIISKREEIQGGRLAARSEEFRISLNASVNGKMCEISLEDNGMGIKKEHLEEDKGVNVMYFTTKGATKGTGMGLALMRQFIRYNGGTMKVESEYAQWTRIIFTLPLATKEQIEKFQDNNGQDGL